MMGSLVVSAESEALLWNKKTYPAAENVRPPLGYVSR
jgi:hypothetical protein